MNHDICQVESLESRLLLSAYKTVDYIPLAAGSWWDFSGTSDGQAFSGRRSVATKPVTIGGVKTIQVSQVDGSSYYSFSAGALRIHKDAWVENGKPAYELYDKPFVQMPATFTVGQVFNSSSPWHGVNSGGNAWTGASSSKTTIVRAETVKVPAGTFSAVRITIDTRLTKNDGAGWHKSEHTVTTAWLVKGIGYVKMVEVDDETSTVRTSHSTTSMAMTKYRIG